MTTVVDQARATAGAVELLLGQRSGYQPRGGALEAYNATESQVLIAGPAGTGKSRAMLERIHRDCLAFPGFKALLVRKTLTSLTSSGVQTFIEHVARDELETGVVRYFGGNLKEPAQFRYSNGSRIMLGGLENAKAIGKVMSTEYSTIFVQEATDISAAEWQALTTRLRHPVGPRRQLLADCNPNRPDHWLKVRCDEGKTRMIYGRHTDNPVLYDVDGNLTDAGREYMAILDDLDGVLRSRLRDGDWVQAEGMIYGGWDESTHLIDRFDIPDDWPRYWVVDFGYTNPFVCQWWAVDPDGRLYRYRELYMTRRTVDDHAAAMLLAVLDEDGAWTEPEPMAVICDHDAEGQAVLARELGLFTVNADKAVTTGIQAVQRRLRPAGDGKPRLFLLRDSLVEIDADLKRRKLPTCTEQEIPGYVWKAATEGKAEHEEPVKLHDHGCDAMRYMAMHLDDDREPNVRWLGG